MRRFVAEGVDRVFVRSAIEAAIRIALIAGIGWWCFRIVRPFVAPALWSIIFAVALFPVFQWVKSKLGGRGGLAATVLVLVTVAILIIPVVKLSMSSIGSVQNISEGIRDGTLTVPPPPEGVAGWPVVGKHLATAWSQASENLQQFLVQHRELLHPIVGRHGPDSGYRPAASAPGHGPGDRLCVHQREYGGGGPLRRLWGAGQCQRCSPEATLPGARCRGPHAGDPDRCDRRDDHVRHRRTLCRGGCPRSRVPAGDRVDGEGNIRRAVR